jgi:alanyl-tRNA synthetase
MIIPELKIIADHLRSSCFLVADGVLPSNEGRGYVLRRIMRRAMRQLHKLGAREALMHKFVDALIVEMGTAYPELARARAVIVETLKNEEEKFRETLEKGLKILEEEISQIKNNELSGKVAFKLYDTYGFPLDLTQDILKEKNIAVNLQEFEDEMEAQKQRARANWKGSGEVADDKIFFDLKEKFGETQFVGYEKLEDKSKVLFVGEGFIILDKTPFYATSGGQRGDDGLIADVEIFETRKFAGNLFAHFFKKDDELTVGRSGSPLFKGGRADPLGQRGGLHQGDEVIAKVNENSRKARASNHSATHLMHKALKEVLGDSISQKGSNVDAQSFTFDFNFNRAMSEQEIKKVEDLVNEKIKSKSDVETKLMNLEEAKNSGAEALFGEKYDEKVRVVSMANSVELCGGTHVKNVSEIEIFKIISEKSIAAGIRRIEAKTGLAAKEYLQEKEEELENLIVNLQQKINEKNAEIKSLDGKEINYELDRHAFLQKARDDEGGKSQKARDDEGGESQKVCDDEGGKSLKVCDDHVSSLRDASVTKQSSYSLSDNSSLAIKQSINDTSSLRGASATKQSSLLLEISQLEEILKKQEKEINNLRKAKLLKNLDEIKSKEINGNVIAAAFFEDVEAKDLREIANELLKKNDLIAIFSHKDGKVGVCVNVAKKIEEKFDATSLIKPLIEAVGGKGGGGKKDFAMGGGNLKEGVSKAIEIFNNLIS